MTPWTALVLALFGDSDLAAVGSPSSGRVGRAWRGGCGGWLSCGGDPGGIRDRAFVLAWTRCGFSSGREVQQVFPSQPGEARRRSCCWRSLLSLPGGSAVGPHGLDRVPAVAMFPPYPHHRRYLFGSIARLRSPWGGMSLASATGLLLLGAADVSRRTGTADRRCQPDLAESPAVVSLRCRLSDSRGESSCRRSAFRRFGADFLGGRGRSGISPS